MIQLIVLCSLILSAFSLGTLYEPPEPFTQVNGYGDMGQCFAEFLLVNNETNIGLVKLKFETALNYVLPQLTSVNSELEILEVDLYESVQDDGLILVLEINQIQLPHDMWMRNTVLTRIRSAMMNQHPDVIYDQAHHVELKRFHSVTYDYKWKTPDLPNILFFISDDQGYNDVGWHNGNTLLTPNLDAYRREGVEVTYFYTYPICSPSRTAIWSGRFTHRHGYGPSINNGNTAQFSGYETVWSEVLKGTTDYYQVLMNKWHLGFSDIRQHPLSKGFDAYLGAFSLEWHTRQDYALNNKDDNGFLNFYLDPSQTPTTYTVFEAFPKADDDVNISYAGRAEEIQLLPNINSYEGWHNARIIMERQKVFLENFIKNEAINHRPLHMCIGSRLPHTKVVKPNGFSYPKSGWSNYYKMVYAMDFQLGDLVDEMKKYGLWKDTVFIFMSDNTGLSNDQGQADNGRLQGRKNLVWDMRVVNLFKGTASSKSPIDYDAFNTNNNDLMHSVDLFKTVVTGIAKVPEEQYANAYKCPTCLPHNNNILDGINQWESIKTRGGIDHISTSKRMFVTHVITKEQIEMQNADDIQLEQILPQHTWDKSFWDQSTYAQKVEQIRTSYNHIRACAIQFGTGYIQYGRYSMFFAERGGLDGDPSINPSKREQVQDKCDPHADISFLLDKNGLPKSIPGHDDRSDAKNGHRAYLHDVWGDERKYNNLLSAGNDTSQAIQQIATEMLHYYLQEQDPSNSTIDLKLKYMWMNDPAQNLVFGETGEWRSFCHKSIICKHDTPVVRSLGPNIPKPPKIVPPETIFFPEKSVTPIATSIPQNGRSSNSNKSSQNWLILSIALALALLT